jgi:tetratricopeptide (TPR) repeat protein
MAMSHEIYPEEFKRVRWLIGAGKYQEAFDGLSLINQKYDLNQVDVLVNFAGFLIDIGDGVNDPEIVRKGIEFLETNKERICGTTKELEFTYWYDLGNGYAALHRIEKRKKEFKYSIDSVTRLQKAKDCYYNATGLLKKNEPTLDKEQIARLYVNLGNCFEGLGRNIEAIESFDKALNYFPEHPMALANKAKNFCFLTHVSEPDYHLKLYYEAYWMLRKACKSDRMEEAPRKFFKETYLIPLKKILRGKMNLRKKTGHVRVWHKRFKSQFKRFYVDFCLEHKLYLNPHGFYCDCYGSVGDPIVIQSMLVRSSEKDKYLQLCRFLNQVKQEFVTARFLLAQSKFKDPKLRFVDAKVAIINTLDYTFTNVYQELLKFSLRLAFSALDKIALFLNEYMNLVKRKKIYFRYMWYTDHEQRKGLNEKLKAMDNNVGLVA